MSLSPNQLLLYAADPVDLASAWAVAALVNLPPSQVTGDFGQAWTACASGQSLVVAVGGPAHAALYYNPCGWPNPANSPAGSTPFSAADAPTQALLPANVYLNGAGSDRTQTFYRTAWLVAYALATPIPGWGVQPPPGAAPQNQCPPSALVDVPCPCHPSPPPSAGGVGVYATFSTLAAAQAAIAQGWAGLATTAGLGTPYSPYTAVLTPNGDAFIAQALAQTSGEQVPFWISFWTVSGPAGSDSFFSAGLSAGKYAAAQVKAYSNRYLPNFVVLDPEGYNALPQTPQEWNQWLMGWAQGIYSVDVRLQPAFYVNQSQYQSGQLGQVALPAFVALSPIEGNAPFVSGPNLVGYHGFFATCPVAQDLSTVLSWGGRYNLVQFQDSGVDCGP